jgi:hypothetical protein
MWNTTAEWQVFHWSTRRHAAIVQRLFDSCSALSKCWIISFLHDCTSTHDLSDQSFAQLPPVINIDMRYKLYCVSYRPGFERDTHRSTCWWQPAHPYAVRSGSFSYTTVNQLLLTNNSGLSVDYCKKLGLLYSDINPLSAKAVYWHIMRT